jgi:hypothetical protein
VPVGAGRGDGLVDPLDPGGPGDQPFAGERVDAERARLRRLRLFGVGADHLEVGATAEIREVVAGAEPDVVAARGERDAQVGESGDRTGEIGGAVDEVIDHGTSQTPAIVVHDRDNVAEGS